jgi:hypothetical protein
MIKQIKSELTSFFFITKFFAGHVSFTVALNLIPSRFV